MRDKKSPIEEDEVVNLTFTTHKRMASSQNGGFQIGICSQGSSNKFPYYHRYKLGDKFKAGQVAHTGN